MNEVRGITELKNYGKVDITLKSVMDKQQISIYQMSKLTELKYNTIKTYYNNEPITRVDLDVLAKICFVLKCEVKDILVYTYNNS